MALLTAVSVFYLSLVAVMAVLAALGVPLGPAALTGDLVGRLLAALVVLVDVVSLVLGHRPDDLLAHLGYAVCAVALPPVIGARRAEVPSMWLIALTAAANAVVLVRLAQTWT